MRETLPVIDLFAGPGGLGEGFSSYRPAGRQNRAFKILVSVECAPEAHCTLELRSFYRQFSREVPDDYFEYLRGEIDRDVLFSRFPVQASLARQEAMHARLGEHDDVIYRRIGQKLARIGDRYWVLVGGPPCQAYSIVGRSKQKETIQTDKRQLLYQEYLKILARFQPAVFVMENVKGLISSTARLDDNARPHLEGKQELIFLRMLRDLKSPLQAVRDTEPEWVEIAQCGEGTGYRIYSLVQQAGDPDNLEPTDFIIRSENYGIPQTRHRVILLGVRDDLAQHPSTLQPHPDGRIPIEQVIDDLPALRSQISKSHKNALRDSPENWRKAIRGVLTADWVPTFLPPARPVQLRLFEDQLATANGTSLRCAIIQSANQLVADVGIGERFLKCTASPTYRPDWYTTPRLSGVCNHESRAHMISDLHRYLYLACFAAVYGVSPTMKQFPPALLPDHQNLADIESTDELAFDDRFRVQVRGYPSTTITSHISKDGHYNVHYDASQCRSLTVREAARLQTFPDDYFFEGPRTEQYVQVGNAVPPLLARQIAAVVYDLLERANGAH